MSVGSIFVLNLFKNQIIFNFVKFMATIRGEATNFPPSSFVVVVGSGIRDPGSNNNRDNKKSGSPE
jgi:hypothetical protein